MQRWALCALTVVAMAGGCGPGSRSELPADAPIDAEALPPCDPRAIGTSYIGCEYYATIIGNAVGTDFDFAIAIANTTDQPAEVTIDGGALTAPMSVTVGADAVHVQTLPWHPELKLCMHANTLGCQPAPAALARRGGYHIVSSRPVTVYQFNPLEFRKNGQHSTSNDASLLIPTNAWRERYVVAAWPDFGVAGSEMAIVAAHDGTQVTIHSRAATTAAGGAPKIDIGVPHTVTLDQGDVLELTSAVHGGDFTGSQISATKPIQVVAGHYCAYVPEDKSACDHLEEIMFPADTLGVRYVITAPAVPTIPDGKIQYVRVVATTANTTLTYDPPLMGVPTTLANVGDFITIPDVAQSFVIHSDKRILVAQYMEGQQAGGNMGDPSMTLAVPVEQYRAEYLFHSPLTYTTNYVDITAPMGATITLDGTPVTLAPIGSTGFGLARVAELGPGPRGDGNHAIQGDAAFGISVYGYGAFTSYWYPGGLELAQLIL